MIEDQREKGPLINFTMGHMRILIGFKIIFGNGNSVE